MAKFLAFAVVLLTSQFLWTAASQSISIAFPAGGETFTAGSTISIQWAGGGAAWPMTISIIDVPAWQVYQVLTTTAQNTGSYSWLINVPAGTYQAYVEGRRDQPDHTWAYSQSFTVVASPGGCAWISNPTAATCPAWCTWNCALNLCYDASCPLKLTQQQCASANGCAWYNNKCRDYTLQYGSFTSCDLAKSASVCGGTQCQWSTYQNACIKGTSSCAWLQQQSAQSCPTEKCYFSPTIGYCYDPSCESKLTSAECRQVGGCAWFNGYCYDYNLHYSGFACSKAQELAECPSSRCHWDGTSCQNGAGAPMVLPPSPQPDGCAWISNPTAATCPAGCTFDANLNVCYDAKCPLKHTPAACSAVSGCTWTKNQCRDYNMHYGTITCAQSTSPLTCGGLSCSWSYKQNKCLSASSNSACTWLPQGSLLTCPDRCSYSAPLGFCYNEKCTIATNECGCTLLSSVGCAWYNGRCLDYNVQYGNYACSSATSKALCGKTCTWNAATSTCA